MMLELGTLVLKSQISENVRISSDKTTTLDATLVPEVIEEKK